MSVQKQHLRHVGGHCESLLRAGFKLILIEDRMECRDGLYHHNSPPATRNGDPLSAASRTQREGTLSPISRFDDME